MSYCSEPSYNASKPLVLPPRVVRSRAIYSPKQPQHGRTVSSSESEFLFSPEKPCTKTSQSATDVDPNPEPVCTPAQRVPILDAISTEIWELTQHYESLLRQQRQEYYESLCKYADTAEYMHKETDLRYELEDRNEELKDENAVLRVRLMELMEEVSILKSNCRIEAWRRECGREVTTEQPKTTHPAQPPVQNAPSGNKRRRRPKPKRNQVNQTPQGTPQRRPWA